MVKDMTALKVTFHARDFSRVTPLPQINLEVVSFSKIAIGGPETATLEATAQLKDLQTLLALLRCPVEIHDEHAAPLWYGYLERIEIPIGPLTLTADLANLVNRAAVAYTLSALGDAAPVERETTAWAQDDDSVSLYGIKEELYPLTDVSAAAATAERDRQLADHANPAGRLSGRSASMISARLTCRGWFNTLAWRFVEIPVQLIASYETIGALSLPLGQATTAEHIYQSFNSGPGFDLKHIEVFAAKVGTPSAGMRVSIYNDNGGEPGTTIATKTLAEADIPTTAAYTRFTLAAAAGETLAPATLYWLGIDRVSTPESAHYYTVGTDAAATYADGSALVDYNGYLAPQTYDLAFKLYDASDVLQIEHDAANDTAWVARLTDIEQAAQAFDLSEDTNLQQIDLYLAAVGTPADNLEISLYTNTDDASPAVLVDTLTLPGSSVPASAAWLSVSFSTPLAISGPGYSYFLVLSRSGAQDYQNYYTLALDPSAGYTPGPMVSYDGYAWAYVPADLPFRLYANALVETTQQVKNIIDNYGQFIAGCSIIDASGISTESHRAGDTRALYEVRQLLGIGTAANNRRLLAEMDPSRRLEISEQPASTDSPHLIDKTGSIFDPLGHKLRPAAVPAGIWLKPLDLLDAPYLSYIGGLQTFFIERITYNARADTISFEQTPD